MGVDCGEAHVFEDGLGAPLSVRAQILKINLKVYNSKGSRKVREGGKEIRWASTAVAAEGKQYVETREKRNRRARKCVFYSPGGTQARRSS